MKQPFDLEQARNGHPLIARRGDKAKFIAHEKEAVAKERVIALIDGYIYTFNEAGEREPNICHNLDLFLDVPEPKKVKKEGWIIVARHNLTEELKIIGTRILGKDEVEQDQAISIPGIGFLKIHWEEEVNE